MITIDNVQYRNLEEQVKKNMEDIEVLKNYDVSITGQVSNPSELPDTADNGTMYIVGTSPSYDLYVYVDGWINLGDYPAIGPKGEQGDRGPIGLMGERGSQWYTLQKPVTANQNDQFLDSNGIVYSYTGTNWQATNNIRGPQGIPGIQGEQGEQGIQGPVGPQGEVGPAGQSFSIIGLVANTAQLPDPSTVPDNYAYMVGTAAPYDLYVQVVPEGEPQQWLNAGQVEGVVGPQGPVGPQGAQGPQGPQGPPGPPGLSWKGEWTSGDKAYKDDAYYYNGDSYVANENNITTPPNGSDGKWSYLAKVPTRFTRYIDITFQPNSRNLYIAQIPKSQVLFRGTPRFIEICDSSQSVPYVAIGCGYLGFANTSTPLTTRMLMFKTDFSGSSPTLLTINIEESSSEYTTLSFGDGNEYFPVRARIFY